jgi:hypothetical protein
MNKSVGSSTPILILVLLVAIFLLIAIYYSTRPKPAQIIKPTPIPEESVPTPYVNTQQKTLIENGQENVKKDFECPFGAVCKDKPYPLPDDPNFASLGQVPLDQRGYSGDCYLFPSLCGPNEYCQLNDRIRWSRNEQATRGRCVRYQQECFSCTATAEDYLLDKEKYSAFNGKTVTPEGQLTERTVTCAPNLICSGNTIPDLPSTCLRRRPPDRRKPPTRKELIQWCLRFVRLGGRASAGLETMPCAHHREDGVCLRYEGQKICPMTKGASREALLETTNHILKVLWPKKFGPFPGPFIPGEHDKDVLICEDPKYDKLLTDVQRKEGRQDYRMPVRSIEENEKDGLTNAPPCLYQLDYAYNDEGPSLWCLLHCITANIGPVLNEDQRTALRTIPMFLQQYLSCSTCRGNIKDHLFRIKMPESYFALDFYRFYWQCHNYVSSQTAHTRCGTNTSCGLPWALESSICAGVYHAPWYISFEDSYRQWHVPDK